MLRVGVLRYPNLDHPYFKMYWIRLVAWSDCSRILAFQNDANGIRGFFRERKYEPRRHVLESLPPSVFDRAIEQANEMFQ